MPGNKCYLQFGGENEATLYPSYQAAFEAFRTVARQLWNYGQEISAVVWVSDPSCPEFILRCGRRGGMVAERC